MRRHVIIGQFGQDDQYRVRLGAGEAATRLNLVSGERRLDYGIGRALDDLSRLGLFPTEIGLDLLILAAHVQAADTRVSRSSESQDSWTREFRLIIPVSDPDRWAPTTPVLVRMLNFLTGDRWAIGFRARPHNFVTLVPQESARLIELPFNSLALFSGGLDSLINAIDELEARREPLFVSHAGEGATSDAQNSLFNALKNHYTGREFNRLRLWMTFPKRLVSGSSGEDTTRGRSFLFFALGIFIGSGLGHDFTLLVPENGLIALNVPLDPLRLGALSTHTTHPFYIARWNELLTILAVTGKVENPYWDRTKGEMITLCANNDLLLRLAPSSISCSSPTKGRWQGLSTQHCGYCLPCIIRRAALNVGFGQGIDSTLYTIADLSARSLDTRQSEGQQVRSFQIAIDRLRARQDLAAILIHKPGPLSDEPPDKLVALADVYRRGLEEVGMLLASVRTCPR